MALIELERAGLRFRKEIQGQRKLFVRREWFWALREVSFKLNDGDRLAVIGANGSGKSTLMRVMAGVFEPDEGRISRALRPTLLTLGAGFNPQLSGRQNIRLNGALLGLTRSQVRALEPEIEAFAALEDFIDAPLRTYSSGMRVRLGFAIASSLRPDVLLLDETLATGDRFFRERARERLAGMADRCRALVLVSHQEGTLASLCNRAIWLDHGRLRADGPLNEVLDAYRGSQGGKAA